MWIFGYGSLIWRPDFPFVEHRMLCLDGWSRRFWQGSTDHRGVPGAPGRVVTLVRGGTCWGKVYRLHDRDIDRVMARLDVREQGGYHQQIMDLGDVQAVTYFAAENNPNWLGPASVDQIARTVCSAVGPSGSNMEYLERLVHSLGDCLDEHTRDLWNHCRKLRSSNSIE